MIQDLQTARDFSELIEDNPEILEQAEEFVAAMNES